MILILFVAVGLLVGLLWAWFLKTPYHGPDLKAMWLALLGFLPQILVARLPNLLPNRMDAASLTISQVVLLGFAWLNRHVAGMYLFICGAALNLLVMGANGGFMPVSPQTADRLFSEEALLELSPGDRIGPKDILLLPQQTRLEWLADRFLPPAWFPFQAAFSFGDVFIAVGVFWMLVRPNTLSGNRGT